MAYSQSTNTDSLSDIAEQINQILNDGPKEQLDIRVRPATETYFEKDWDNYPMKTSPRGLAVIFNYDIIPNHERREGSREDVKNLKELCIQLGFEVNTHIDRTKQETLYELDSIRKNPLMQTTDMLMVFIMSHGKESSIICSDGQTLETEKILRKFTCVELKGKPKFFAFQACRGEDEEVGISNKIMVDSSSAKYDSIWQDMYIVYSAIPGYVSYRTRSGSWFIQSLVRVFMNKARKCHLKTLVRDVGTVMNCLSKDQNKQMIEISDRGFTKNLYFNPGLKMNISNLSLKNMEKNVNDPGMKKHNINPGLTFTDHEIERRIQTLSLSKSDDILEKVAKIELPGLDGRDKSTRLWSIALRPSLAQKIEKSGGMLTFLDNNPGPNPKLVLDSCYMQAGLIMLKENYKGSEQNYQSFLNFMKDDRDSFTAYAAARFMDLKTKHDKAQSALNTTLRFVQQLWPYSNIKWTLEKADGLLSQSDKLPLWASKFHRGLSDFDDKNSDFKEYQIKEFLRNVYSKKCDNSLEPLHLSHRFLIYVRALYCLLKLTYLAHVPEKFLEELPGFNPVEEALDEIEATELCVRKFTDVCNSLLSGFFEAALTAKPEWRAHLCYVPDLADIPRTDQNFVKTESFLVLKFGGSYNYKKDMKVYQTQEIPGFTRLSDTDAKVEYVYRFHENKLQDGGYRTKFDNGDSCIGQRKFAKSPDAGKEDRIYRLRKFASGNIQYQEQIWVNGQDEGWRYLTRYTFNPDKLEWNKVNL